MTEEIKNLLLEQGQAFELFKKAQDKRFETLERELEPLAKARARAQFAPGSAANFASDEERKAFDGFLRHGGPLETKGMATDNDPAGGYLVPSYLDNRIQSVLASISPIRAISRVVQVEGESFGVPVMRTRPGASWAAERASRPETTAPELALISPPSGDLFAYPLLTQRVLDDAAFDAAAWIVQAVAETFAATESAAFVNGDGVNKPMGFLSFASGRTPVTTADSTRAFGTLQYTPTGNSGAFASTNPADALIELLHSLAAPYRQNAAWLMSSDALRLVRQFKETSTGAYLWQPSAQAGQPATLFGLPCLECPDMPSVSSGSYSVAVGDFQRGYVITDRLGTRMIRDELTSRPYVGFYTLRRTGGSIVDSNAIKLLRFASS